MPRLHRGLFITFEGGDGSGKSTQAHLLAARLRAAGHVVQLTAEPGGTIAGRHVKQLFEQAAAAGLGHSAPTPWTEAFLFLAARAQNIQEVVRPALDRGDIVLCDRFADSTIAYQGYGRGLDLEQLEMCNRVATGGLTSNLTLLLDVPAEQALARAQAAAGDKTSGRTADSLGGESLDFHQRVRSGFLELAKRHPDRVVVLDAGRTIEIVAEDVWRHVLPLVQATAQRAT